MTDGTLRIGQALGAPVVRHQRLALPRGDRRPRPRGAPVHPDRHHDGRPQPLEVLDRGVLSEVRRRDAHGVRGSARGLHEHPGRRRALQPRADVRPVPSPALPGARRVHARLLPRAPGRRGPPARYGPTPADAVVERLRYELGVIETMGFSGYFLVVWDFIALRAEPGDRGRARAEGPRPARSSRIASASRTSIRSVTGSLRAIPEPRAQSRCPTWTSTSPTTAATRSSTTSSSATAPTGSPRSSPSGPGGQGGHPRRRARPRDALRRRRPDRQARARASRSTSRSTIAREVARRSPSRSSATRGRPSSGSVAKRAGGLHAARLVARLRRRDLGRAAHGARPALQGPQERGDHHRVRDGADREARAAQDGLPGASGRSP